MNNIYEWRKKVDNLVVKNGIHKESLENEIKKLNILDSDYEDHKKVREVYQQAALFTQSYLEEHISSIVTNALQSVFFDKDISFKAVFNKKRNSTECELYIIEDGREYDLLEDRGFGVSDLASFSLRVAYVLLDSCENVLIMDEPFRNLDAVRIPYAAKMVSELSKRLGIQFILITHIDELIETADNVINFVLKNKVTVIE